jgi:dTDP-D-glucose 4,6-dehydratase
MNTVHVGDVCRGLWHLTTKGNQGEVYNLVDCGETSECYKYAFQLKELFSDMHGRYTHKQVKCRYIYVLYYTP